MARELIFKFRDDLLLTEDLPLVGLLKVPPDYFRVAAEYVRQAGIRPINATQSVTSVPPTLRSRWALFLPALRFIQERAFIEPEFLFKNNLIDAPLQVLNQVLYPPTTPYAPLPAVNTPPPTLLADGGGPYPNLYNYFKISLSDQLSDAELSVLLTLFTALLPPVNPFLSVVFRAFHLLSYVYVKEDPMALAFTKPNLANPDTANQHYFQQMQVPPPAPANQGLNVGLTVIEADSWFAGHTQFGSAPLSLIFPLTPPVAGAVGFSLTNPGKNMTLPDHGTKVMGILNAVATDNDAGSTDLCRGIVPKATVRLASCITSLAFSPPTATTHLETVRYDEPGAVLQATLLSLPGDVILIELGLYQQKYPLEVSPAVFDLLTLAFYKKVIVVEASGNQHLYIDNVSSAQPDALDRAELVNLITRKDVNAGIPMDAYRALKARIAVEYAKLGKTATGYASADDFADHYFKSRTNAILVGATVDEAPAAFVRKEPLSSWGPRVKVYAQGQNLLTTAYVSGGSPSPSQFGTMGFTSGAAAIIAGVVTSLQSLAKANKYWLDPTQMSTLLAQGGTPVKKQDALTDAPIDTGGVVPNYKAAALLLQQWIDAAKSNGH